MRPVSQDCKGKLFLQPISGVGRCNKSQGWKLFPLQSSCQINIFVPTGVYLEAVQCHYRIRVFFENRPALYFFLNYTFISAYKIYFFIPYQRYCLDILSVLLNFIANYDCKNENIPPYCL